jgi:hypothetical protein
MHCCTVSSGDSLPTPRDNLSAASFFTLEVGTDRLSQNVGKELSLPAV